VEMEFGLGESADERLDVIVHDLSLAGQLEGRGTTQVR
jgi:hypothetical protein